MFVSCPSDRVSEGGLNGDREGSKVAVGQDAKEPAAPGDTSGGLGAADQTTTQQSQAVEHETFDDLDQKIATSILNPSVRKVVQLCFASLAAVFITVPNDEERDKKARKAAAAAAAACANADPSQKLNGGGGGTGDAQNAQSNRMTTFPMESAFMLWEELLSLNRGHAVDAAVNEKVQKHHRYPGVGGGLLKGTGVGGGGGGGPGGSKGSPGKGPPPPSFRQGFVPGIDSENYEYEGSSDEEQDMYLNSDDDLVDTPLDGGGGGDDDSLAGPSGASVNYPPYTKYLSKTEFDEFVDEMSTIKSSRLWKRGGSSSRSSSSGMSDNRSVSEASSHRDETSSQYSRSSRGTTSSRGSSRANRSKKPGRTGRRGSAGAGFLRRTGSTPSLIVLSKRVSAAAAATLRENPRRGSGGGQSTDEDRPTNEELVCLIRDFLIDLGLLTKVAGNVENYYVANANMGGENRVNFPRMMERFTKKKSATNLPPGNQADGTPSSPTSMTMVVERKKEKEYGLRINQEFHFQYGLRLASILWPSSEEVQGSARSGSDSGRSNSPAGQDEYWNAPNEHGAADASGGGNSFQIDKHDLTAVTAHWNSAMAEACLDKSKRNKEKLQQSLKEQFKNLRDAPQQEQAKNDLENYGERFYFACGLAADSRTILVDDPTVHALRMLPTYLMRSSRVVEAATLLSCTGFVRGRVMILGVEEGARWHRQDCVELQRIVLESPDKKEVDEKGVTIAAYNVMMTCLLEKESSYGVNTRQHVPGPKNMTESQKMISSEVGKAFHAMGLSASKQGFLKLSLECYKEALNSKRSVYGHDDVSVAASLHNMGNVYLSKGWYQQATECYEEVLRVQKLKLGDKNKKVCATLHSLGTVYGMTGAYAKAIMNYQEALVLEKIRYGEDQLPVAKTLNSIGIIHGMNGSYADAVQCYREALRIKRLKLGFGDEEVASTLYNLGIVQSKNGQYKEAMLSYKEALRIRRMLVGDDHEDVARILHYIGTVHADLGEYDDAILCYKEALDIRKSNLGPHHEDVARTLHNLGLAYDQNNDDEKAMEYFEEALTIARKNFGSEHEKVADTLHRIGVVCNKTGKYEQAVEYYDEALRIRRIKLGDDHLDCAATYHNLGDVYYVTNAYDQAMECYEKALHVRRSKLGDEHVDVAATLNNMGVVFLRRGQNNYAIDCYKEALKVRKLRLGAHEKVADTLHNIGLVYKNMAEHDLAMEHYREALRLRKLTLGEKHAKVADTLYNMGIVYSNSGQYEEALECYDSALKTYEGAEVGKEHPSVVNTIDWITWIKRQLETPLV